MRAEGVGEGTVAAVQGDGGREKTGRAGNRENGEETMTIACGREKYGGKRSRSCGRIKSGREDGEKRSHRGEGRGEAGRKRWHGDGRTGRGSRRAINPTTRHLPPPKARQRTPPTDKTARQNGTTKRTSSGVLFDFSGVKSSPPDPEQAPQERTQETGGMYDDDLHTDSPFLPYFRGLPLTTGYAEGGLYVRRFGFFRRSPEKARADGENKRERRGREQERGGTRKRVRERLTFRARYSMIKTETKVTNKWRNFL